MDVNGCVVLLAGKYMASKTRNRQEKDRKLESRQLGITA